MTKPVGTHIALIAVVAIVLIAIIRARRWPKYLAWGVAAIAAIWPVVDGVYNLKLYQLTKKHPTGLEYQLTDDAHNEDALAKPTHRTAALYDMPTPVGVERRPIGEFMNPGSSCRASMRSIG